jgi:hypothetical protein
MKSTNKISFKAVLALCIYSLSVSTFAQWTVPVKVKTLVVVSSGGINVRVDPPLANCQSQSGYGGKYASIYPSHPGLKGMHANLLMALATGTQVQLWFSDEKCTIGEITIGDPWSAS